jgi:hypothetical protein
MLHGRNLESRIVSYTPGAGGVTTLAALTDVNTAGVSVGDALTFGGVTWGPVAAGGGMVLIQTQTIAGAAVTDITFAGLNGDVDKQYLMIGRVTNPLTPAGPGYELRPNNATTNLECERCFANPGGVFSTQASMQLCGAGALSTSSFHAFIQAQTGMARTYQSFATDDRGTNDPAMRLMAGTWDESVTNITSLVVHCASAGGIGIGSEISLYKMAT